MKSSIIFTTLLSASNNYAAAYINPLRGIQQYLYQTTDEIISFSDESASISCIRPINKLRSMDIVQACEELDQGQLPYECDDGDGLCCTITTQSELLSDEEESAELPFKDVTISGFGTCHRIEDEGLGEGQCDPTASEDEMNDQCNCQGGWADCYEGDCGAPEGMGCCVCTMPGRPYVDSSGNTLVASIATVVKVGGEVTTHKEDTSQSTADKNCTTTAYHLGQQWAANGLGEHASVASFSAFSIALLSTGAPSDLVEDALTAGLDELRHAKTSFDIATKLLGKEIAPGPLPVSKHEFDRDIKKLALSVAKEGCVDESLSALELEAEVELLNAVLDGNDVEGGNTKYAGIDHETLTWIRDELRIIASEESTHAALAWRTFEWVCSVDADACDAVKEQVLNKDELEKAFQRRFGSFAGTTKTLNFMKDSWARISMHNI